MLRLNMSDQKLHALIELADSIPLPKSTHNPGREIFLVSKFHILLAYQRENDYVEMTGKKKRK